MNDPDKKPTHIEVFEVPFDDPSLGLSSYHVFVKDGKIYGVDSRLFGPLAELTIEIRIEHPDSGRVFTFLPVDSLQQLGRLLHVEDKVQSALEVLSKRMNLPF